MEKIKLKSRRKTRTLLAGILLPIIVLTALLVSAIFAYSSQQNNKKYFQTTTATISKIDVVQTDIRDYDSQTNQSKTESKIEHIVYVDYTINGDAYHNVKLNHYNTSMRVGDTIEIRYDNRNPGKIVSTINYGTIFLVVAICAYGIYLIILPVAIIKQTSKKRNLMKNGICHRVPIVDISYLYRVPRHRHGRKYEDFPKCGMYFDVLYDNKRFSSEDFKLTDKLSTGCTVNLYLDRSELEARKKRKTLQFRKKTASVTNYYIDLNSVEPAQ